MYNPSPVKKSAAEIEFRAVLEMESDPGRRMQIARDFVTRHVEDVPLGRLAGDIMRKAGKEQAEVFFRVLSDEHPESIAACYYYARIADDTLIWEEKARWALAKDSSNYWGWLMFMAAEWHKHQPDLALVYERVARAIQLDPSRPEGYLFLGQYYEETDQWMDAYEAYRAGLVCDSTNAILRQSASEVEGKFHQPHK